MKQRIHSLVKSTEMASQKLFLAVIHAIVVAASAICGTDMPVQPPPGGSESVTITYADPNLGLVERSFLDTHPSRILECK